MIKEIRFFLHNKRNEFKIIDDFAIIFIKRKNGDAFEVIIDLDDLEKVKKVSWHVGWKGDIKGYYAEYCKYLGIVNGKYKYKTITMQNYIMEPKKNEVTDHIDHNGLNNKKSNLRVIQKGLNSKNRKGKNSNNKSGYRNICYINGLYVVQLQINKINTRLGSFNSIEDARNFAEEMRTKYYGDYRGNE